MSTGTIERLVCPAQWKAVDGDDNLLEGYASTFGNIDLQDDVVEAGAFRKTVNDLRSAGMKLPFLADHHAITNSVLGSVVDAREDKQGLRIRARFSSAASAQDTRMKMLEGHIDRMSIGYEPVEFAFEERDGRRVRVLKEVRLWEISAVVFPANPVAVVDSVKTHVKQLVDYAVHAGVDAGAIEAEFKQRGVVPAQWFSGLDELSDKQVVGSHSTATSTAEWDVAANRGRLPSPMSVATARAAHAWIDMERVEDGEVPKDAAVFLHHEVSADGTPGAANITACQAGIGVLNGGRGGSRIPDADRQGVWNHLARHLRDADLEPPELASLDSGGEGDGDDDKAAEPEPLSAKLARADALIEGRDIGDADPVALARIQARLDIEAERAAV